MSRRTYKRTGKGKLYCIDWPEWHVECARLDCSETTLVASAGMCETARCADELIAAGKSEMEPGWVKKGGLWFCPKHKP